MSSISSPLPIIPPDERVTAELLFRRRLWEQLLAFGGPHNVTRDVIRRLRMYGGAQGIWVDAERTRGLAPDGGPVAVGLLHTGRHYADDLSETGIIYHYPSTNRGRGRDDAEVLATKSSAQLALPVFTITPSDASRERRSVHLGWVVDWDDRERLFLVTFADAPSPKASPGFRLFDEDTASRLALVARRPNQQRFKFAVIARYGAACAVCGISTREVLDAVHLAAKADRGSDAPGNGLVLCATHHRAFDHDLFGIEPRSGNVHVADESDLRITNRSLAHLPCLPHDAALEWRWARWLRATATRPKHSP